MNGNSGFFDFGSKFVGKDLETAPKGPQARGAGVQPRPHPGHIDLIMPVFTKFANHHRLPHAFVDFVAGIFAHPGIGGGLFERAPVIGQPQVKPYQTKTNFVDAITQARVSQRSWNGIKGVKLALVIHNADWFREKHLIRPAQLFNQTEQMGIGLKPMVIKTLNRPIPMGFFKAGSQTSGFC